MNAVFFNEYIQTSPRFMTDFTPWTLFVDTGIISVLLLLGKLMRVKIRFIQRLFIPPSLLAGFIGLSLGPHGFGIIPLSTQTGTYAGILIAFIFGALPLISQKGSQRRCRQYRQACGHIHRQECCCNGLLEDCWDCLS